MSPVLCFGLLAFSFLFMAFRLFSLLAFALLCGRLLLTLRIVGLLGLLALWRLATLLGLSLLGLLGNRLYPLRDWSRRVGENLLCYVVQECHARRGRPCARSCHAQ